jgi:hypothetical protein
MTVSVSAADREAVAGLSVADLPGATLLGEALLGATLPHTVRREVGELRIADLLTGYVNICHVVPPVGRLRQLAAAFSSARC